MRRTVYKRRPRRTPYRWLVPSFTVAGTTYFATLEGTIGASPWNGVKAYWKLDEASGTRADSHGTNHLTPINAPSSAAGKINNGVALAAASSQALQSVDTPDLHVGSAESFTFAAWVYFDTLPGGFDAAVVVSKNAAGMGAQFELYYHAFFGQFLFNIYTTGSNASLTATFGAPATDTWYFVCAWFDHSTATGYFSVNNGAADSAVGSGTPFQSVAPFTIGRESGGAGSLDGRIDEVGFWKRVLIADERTALYTSGNALVYTGLGGTLGRQTNAVRTGALTPAAVVLQNGARSFTGALTPTGTLIKSVERALSGALTPTGALATALLKLLDVTGAITPTATLIKHVARALTGALTPAGTLTKSVARALTGALTPTAVLLKHVARALLAALTPTAVLDAEKIAGLIQITLDGAITPAGALLKSTARSLAGALTPTATLVRSLSRALAGTLSPAGTLVKHVARSFAGAVTPSAVVTASRVILVAFTGALTSSGALARTIEKVVSGALTPTGALGSFALSQVLNGALAPVGALLKDIAKTFSGTVASSGLGQYAAPGIDPTLDTPVAATARMSEYVTVVRTGTHRATTIRSGIHRAGVR